MNTLSLYKFSENYHPFSAIEYSQFKFGSKDIARKFGCELATKFIYSGNYRWLKAVLKSQKNRVIVMSSPYVHIPTATFAMKDYFLRDLNCALVGDGLLPAIETKISRSSSYREEYGDMTKEQRMEVMQKDTFHVDKTLLINNVCLFLDDIRITGAHQHRIQDMLDKYEILSEGMFLFYAELTDQSNPNIENKLNYAFVKDLVDLDKIIKNHDFLLNTRIVKYILNAPADECKTFLKYQKHKFLHTLYCASIANGYHLIEEYKPNLASIKKLAIYT